LLLCGDLGDLERNGLTHQRFLLGLQLRLLVL
jgi:hypothetical protein